MRETRECQNALFSSDTRAAAFCTGMACASRRHLFFNRKRNQKAKERKIEKKERKERKEKKRKRKKKKKKEKEEKKKEKGEKARAIVC